VRLYVAASSTELDRAEAFMTAARLLGFEITFDWVSKIREVGAANPADAPLALQAQWSARDLAAIAVCEVFVLLAPLDRSPARGAFVELGSAVTLAKPSIVVRSPLCHSICQALASAQAGTDAEALAILRRWRTVHVARVTA
jgi:hypothetical protein